MGYIITLAVLLLVVPLLFILLTKRSTAGSGVSNATHDRGVTVAEPSSDQPTPEAGAINQTAPGADRKLPPG